MAEPTRSLLHCRGSHAARSWPAITLSADLHTLPLLVDDYSAAHFETHTEAERCLPRRVSMGAVLEVIEVLARAYTVLK